MSMKSRPTPARLSLILSLCLAATAPAQVANPGEELRATYLWEDAAKTVSQEALMHQQLIDAPTNMGGKVLKISRSGGPPLQVNVLTILHPPITADVYFLRGEVQYVDVFDAGYLEMWNSFPGGGQYFSRTLGQTPGDPMARLSGSSDWRPFVLPFNATGASGHPEKLAVNVVLPGGGTVYLTELQLFQAHAALAPAAPRLPAAYVFAGGVLIAALLFLGSMARRRYRQRAEWRRMTAMDA